MSRLQFSYKSSRPAFAPKSQLVQDLKEEGYLSGPNGHLGSEGECEPEEDHLMALPEKHHDEDEQLVDRHSDTEPQDSDDFQTDIKDLAETEEKRVLHEDGLTDSAEVEATNSVDTVEVSDGESFPDSVNSVEISDLGGTDESDSESSCTGNSLPVTDEPLECSTAPGNQETNELHKQIASSLEEQYPYKEGDAAEEDAEGPEDADEALCTEDEVDLESGILQEGSITDTGYVHCKELAVEDLGTSVGANQTKTPLLFEECPYDVIGPSCDPDPSHSGIPTIPSRNSCISEDTWEGFQPYSVIESVPADEVAINTTGDHQWTSEEQAAIGICKLDPCYISSNDVDEREDSQVHPKQCTVPQLFTMEYLSGQCLETCEDRPQSKDDDYADIEDSGDLDHLECPSSEDYVEIGDDDDDAGDADHKRMQKDSNQTDKPILNHRNCQPRFRLCAITVPADIDLSGTEHTNRLVLADTSDALEDDIDAEGHIVPYFEDSDTERDNVSDEHVYEEAGLDSEGENFHSLERKSVVTRSRSLSGKVPGYVPETVPEEPSIECQNHDYYTVALDESHNPRRDTEEMDLNQIAPSLKTWRFNLYPRSFSVEGRDMPTSVYKDSDCSLGEEGRMKRMDDNLSLPFVISSSGSFSQRSHQASSGMSTPTSVVDIPPPFELAYITKKPITKSSPSLLIENDLPEKQKKKKSSFKRFLALKFKRKKDSKLHLDLNIPPSRSSSESSHHGPFRIMDMDGRSVGSSPQSCARSEKPKRLSDDSITTFLFYNDGQTRKSMPKAIGNRVSRVESFEDRSRPPFMPLPLTKPRSISFPSADTSDYENIPAISSDYENIQIPPRRPIRVGTFTDFFDDPSRMASSANENDGYVDMSSFTGFDSKSQTPDQESESAYTEPYKVCPASGTAARETTAEEDQGRTSEEEDGCADHSFDRHIDGRSRAYYIAKQLVDSERLHVRGLRLLHEDFRAAVGEADKDDGQPALGEERLREILGQLPEVYELHCSMAAELEDRIAHWEDSPRIADVILSRRAQFGIFTAYVNQYDRNMTLLDDSRKRFPAFSSIVRQFEHQSPMGGNVPMKHQLLQVIVRVLQYRMLLTDYLNNLSPDSQEYENTQAALVIVSDVADHANDSLRQGENLLRLVNIEYSVGGQRDLVRPARVFVKEGTLMKVSRKSRQPRHLFLMNDLMLYTYPQQDGKYRLKNTLPLTGMRVSKPVLEDVQNALKIEVADISITLSASSCGEREDWFHTLSRTVAEHAREMGAFGGSSCEAREKLWVSLGEKAPTLVPMSNVTMCMSCATEFSITLRRHHCQACGKAVCRSCARNKYPLKYLRDRVGKVCDHCYAELKKRDDGADRRSVSPQPFRSSRPLSAVFQNIYPPSLWRTRRSTPNLSQVSGSTEGSTMSGSLQRRKRSKRNWKKLWFLIKDKVLYTFSTREDKVASESLPLRGFTVKLPEKPEGDATNIFQLYHKKTLYYTFRAEDTHTARRWFSAMEEATVL